MGWEHEEARGDRMPVPTRLISEALAVCRVRGFEAVPEWQQPRYIVLYLGVD